MRCLICGLPARNRKKYASSFSTKIGFCPKRRGKWWCTKHWVDYLWSFNNGWDPFRLWRSKYGNLRERRKYQLIKAFTKKLLEGL